MCDMEEDSPLLTHRLARRKRLLDKRCVAGFFGGAVTALCIVGISLTLLFHGSVGRGEEEDPFQTGRTIAVRTLNERSSWSAVPEEWTPFHTHFSRFRGQSVTLVEVGVQSGGSALMWRWYFGDRLRYIGIDIDPATRRFDNGDWSTIIIGDQSDASFWKNLLPRLGGIDIFIDDGGHTMKQQRQTFFSVYPYIQRGGLYVCEDMATSYVSQFGGSPTGTTLRVPSLLQRTMVGLTQQFVDWLNGIFVDGDMNNLVGPSIALPGNVAMNFADTALSVSFYAQLVFVEKRRISERRANAGVIRVGDRALPYAIAPWDGTTEPMDT